MATSGSTDHTNTRNQIIESALRKMGQLPEGETASAQQVADASRDLENLVKSLQTQGINIWKSEELVLFLANEQQSYALGPTGDRLVSKDSLIITELGADEAATQTSLTVDSITDIADNYIIGITLDDRTIHWTAVNGTPVGATVIVDDALPSAASSGNKVYAFSAKAPRPLRITQARVQLDDTNEMELEILSEEDYFGLSNKSTASTPNSFYYKPTLVNGKLYVWPTVADERQYLNLSAKMPIEDFDAAGNNPDYPVEWHQPLIWLLCSEVYIEYGVTDPATVTKIEKQAEKWFKIVSDYDVEEADIVVMPDFA